MAGDHACTSSVSAIPKGTCFRSGSPVRATSRQQGKGKAAVTPVKAGYKDGDRTSSSEASHESLAYTIAEWWVNVEGPSPSLEQGDKKFPGRYRRLSLVFPGCIIIRSRRKVWRRLRRTVSPICRWLEGKAWMLYLLFLCRKTGVVCGNTKV